MKNWIVVVDDDALSLTSARTMLAAEDMKVSCLPSGKGLLKFMEKNDPDLILLDVMMPEFDGFETLAALREQQKARSKPETPVIFLTGDSDHESEQQGLKLGAADYIHKPFNKDILISRIRNTINNSKKIVSLTEHATKDKLTGLFNKAEGISRIRETLHNSPGALLMLDMDSFKLVNDLFGHEKGDQILKGFADLSKFNTRGDDILCRIGGDEFLFFCGGLHGEQAVSALTDRLNQQLEDLAIQLLGENHGIPLGISVGAVMAPEYGTDYDVLFNLADEAMYRTKKNGKHGCTLYVDSDTSFDSVQDPNEELVRITKILEERNQGREALVLGTDVFSAVFQFVDRFNSSHDGKALLLLFILEPIDNPEEHVLFEASTSFGDVLKHNLEKSDIILHNKNNQFFVLLPMMQEPDIEGVTNKILSAWREMPVSAHFETKTASQIR
ncbi:MAG: diguanylate cyclase [Lachnospiraceae bacterium]|nr:diguanylate cyclase [Lachnospiraceae bacterium]